MTRRKILFGVGVLALAMANGSGLADVASRPPDAALASVSSTRVPTNLLAQSGGATEADEAGIDTEAAENDPFAYGVALAVIAAHYHAGLAAFEAGEREAGAHMFANGIVEVYVEMADVFARKGVTSLGPKLEATMSVANAKTSTLEDVRRAVRAVEVALVDAERGAPTSLIDPNAIRARIAAEILDRAAAQYETASSEKELEPYLEGYGFLLAARAEARRIAPWLRARDSQAADALQAALELGNKAYPGVKRPPTLIPSSAFVSAASAAKLAMAKVY